MDGSELFRKYRRCIYEKVLRCKHRIVLVFWYILKYTLEVLIFKQSILKL